MTKSKAPKQARKKVPVKRGWKLVFKVLLLLMWVAAAVIVAQLIVGYLMLWILGRETFLQPVSTAIYSALSYILALVLLMYLTPLILAITMSLIMPKKIFSWARFYKNFDSNLKRKPLLKTSKNELGLRDWPTWTDIGLAPIGFIVSTLLAAGLVAIFSLFPWFDAEQVQDVGFSTYLVGFDRIIAFIVLVVVAPIAEELIFRGWLYGKLRPMLSEKMSNVASMILSIFLVSLLFGIIHLQWNVGVNVFAMSVVLCGLREITGTVYAGILTHMIKNGVAFYLLYVLGMG